MREKSRLSKKKKKKDLVRKEKYTLYNAPFFFNTSLLYLTNVPFLFNVFNIIILLFHIVHIYTCVIYISQAALLHLTHAINALLLKQKRAQPAYLFTSNQMARSIRLLKFLKKKKKKKMGAPPSRSEEERPCALEFVRVLPLPRKNDLCVPFPPPSSHPHTTYCILEARVQSMRVRYYAYFRSSHGWLLRGHKRVFRAHPTHNTRKYYNT